MANAITTSNRPAPTAKRVIELSQKLKGRGRLSGALLEELNELGQDTVAYLKHRIASVEAISGSADTKRIEKTEAEIVALEAKSNKAEADYARLGVLERMLHGLRSEGDSAKTKADQADALLLAEIAGFRQPLISALSINAAANIRVKAVKAITPFLSGQNPDQYVNNLPAVQETYLPFQNCMRAGLRDTGVTAAKEICALIEKVLAGEI